MVLYRKSKSVVFLLWAISVFLLCAGSLINFHQNKIWGKPLNFELVAVKREAGKAIIKVSSDETGSHGDLSHGDLFYPETISYNVPAVKTILLPGTPDDLLVSGGGTSSSLRAPPAFLA